MPKGFLVKRAKSSAIYASWRVRHNSEEDRTGSDSGSDYEVTPTTTSTMVGNYPCLGSPDSGYSQSPTSLTFGEAVRKMVASANFHLQQHNNNNNNNNNNLPPPSSKNHVLNLSTIDRQLGDVQAQHEEKLSNLMYCKPFVKSASNNNNNNKVMAPFVDNQEPLNLTGHSRRENSYPEERALSPISPAPSPTPPLSAPLLPPGHLPQHSPITIAPMSSFYFPSLDRLTVSSPNSGRHSIGSPASTTSNPASPRTLGSNPTSPSKKRNATDDIHTKGRTSKKSKAIRKIAFNEDDKSSPISGTIIREPDPDEDGAHMVFGDIEPSLNAVEVTPEARAELAKIENRLGEYRCRLCKEIYGDAFGLAQHRCSRIVHVEYRCPECDKVFNCPANLASHRRWHKPRPQGTKPAKASATKQDNSDGENRRTPSPNTNVNAGEDGKFGCETCGKKFRRQAYLRKHMATHSEDRPYPCQFCGKPFRTEATRAKHMLQHTFTGKETVLVPSVANGGADTTCGICSATFPDSLALEQHGRLHHLPSEAFTCKYCSSTFYSSPGLTRHINKCHPTENPQVILLHVPATRTC